MGASLVLGGPPSGPDLHLPFARDPRWIGRAAEIARLDEHLGAGEIVWLRPALACGGSGAGVTSLAVEYAHRRHGREPGEIVWARFVPGSRDGLYERRYPFSTWGARADAVSIANDMARLAAQGAADGGSEPDVLLVVDAGPHRLPREQLAPFLRRCRVLVISDIHDLSIQDPVIDVGPLSEGEAADFVARLSGRERGAVVELAGALAGLPLSLRLAAGHLSVHPESSAADYLARLATSPGASCAEALSAAFRVAWESLAGSAAGELLQVMALFEPGTALSEARLALSTDLAAEEGAARAAVREGLSRLAAMGLAAPLADGTAVLAPRLVPLARATAEEVLANACAERIAVRLSDPERFARAILERGAAALHEEIRAADGLRDRNAPRYHEMNERFSALLEGAASTTRFDRDRPLSAATVLQQLALDPEAHRRSRGTLQLRERAMAALQSERAPYVTLRRPAGRGESPFRSAGERRHAAAITSDGSVALQGTRSGDVVIWDVQRAEPTRTVACRPSEGQQPFGLALAADGWIAAVSDGSAHEVSTWDLTVGRAFERPIACSPAEQIWVLALSPSGRHLAAMLNTGDLLFVDLREPKRLRRRSLPREKGASPGLETLLRVSADGRRVLLFEGDNPPWSTPESLWVWDLEDDSVSRRDSTSIPRADEPDATAAARWRGVPVRGGSGVAVTADGRRAFTGSPWGRIVAWDLEGSGSRAIGEAFGEVKSMACSADGALLAVRTRADPRHFQVSMRWAWEVLQILDVATGEVLAEVLLGMTRGGILEASADLRTLLLDTGGLAFAEVMNLPVHR
jgi:hypothetical protein